MPKRTLLLKKETLAELGSDDLRAVAGGASVGPTCQSCPTDAPGVCDTLIVRMVLTLAYTVTCK